MSKTSLGEENEKAILAEIEPIIKRFANKTNQNPQYVRSSVAYLWNAEERECRQAVQDWLSANEIGIYGGR